MEPESMLREPEFLVIKELGVEPEAMVYEPEAMVYEPEAMVLL